MIRIRLTSIAVDDQDKAEAFYVGTLGFQVKQNIPMGSVRWLSVVSPADPEGVELSIEPGGQRPEVRAFQDWMRAQGIPWTAFQVDDIDAEHARLTRLGVAFLGDPQDMGAVRGATLNDTYGNLIMLYQAIAD
ncbi:VOC family protein [Brevundimonas lutea]|uniref:VOC family protein n=1 Tax=Brevundimonas lutea TaxID=2293980 RepID=UPI00196A5359|nr:VOC family protein [Brevundimonas lutea]